MEGEFLLEGDQDEVEEGEHGEYGDEDDIVDDGWVAGKRCSDHVTSQAHDDNGKNQLCDAQAELHHVGHLD